MLENILWVQGGVPRGARGGYLGAGSCLAQDREREGQVLALPRLLQQVNGLAQPTAAQAELGGTVFPVTPSLAQTPQCSQLHPV